MSHALMHGELQRGGGGVDAHVRHGVGDGEQVGGGGQDGVRLEVLDQLDLAFGLAAGHGNDGAAQGLGAGVRAQAAGEEAVAVGVVDLHARADAGGAEAAGHELGPVGQVLLGVADHRGPARGARAGVDPGHLALRHREHPERVLLAQVVFGGEGEVAQVLEFTQVVGMDAGLVELALVQGDPVVGVLDRVLQAAELEGFELVARDGFLAVQDGVGAGACGLLGGNGSGGGFGGMQGHGFPTSWGWCGCVRGTRR